MMRWWNRCRRWLACRVVPPHYKTNARYVEALNWYNDFDPEQCTATDAKYEYARSKYEEERERFKQIDGKAESLFRFSAVLSGGLLTVLKIFETDAQLLAWLRPSLACFTAAVVFSLLAKKTAPAASPLRIKDAVMLEGDDPPVKGRLAAALDCAVVGTDVTNNWKAGRCDIATWCVIAGLVLLGRLFFR